MLESLGNMGDFLGGLGVVFTLVYLAMQIRQNSREVKAAAVESILMALSESFRGAAESPSLSRVIGVGLRDVEQLDETESAQFFLWFLSWFRLVEQIHVQHTLGNLSDQIWQGQLAHFKLVRFSTAGEQFWILRQSIFSRDFQDFVDSLSSEGSVPVVAHEIFSGGASNV